MNANNQLMQLRWADVRAEWDWVKPLVVEMQQDLSRDWRYEDVYAACLHNKAQLFVGVDKWCRQVFFVLQSLQNAYTLENTLFIWLAAGECGGEYADFYPDLRAIAKHTGCTSITFKSPRKGWMKAHGVKPVTIEYEIPIEVEEHV